MRVEPGQRARDGGSASAWARIRLLPRPLLLLAFLLFLSTLAPAVAGLIAAFALAGGSGWLDALARRPEAMSGLSLAAALGALLVVERPRSWSPVAYARQLRDRFAKVEADLDGALRRRSGGEWEKRHAPEAYPPDS